MLAPLFWSLPMALMSAELACAMPSDGAFVEWVHRAFGPLVGFINGILVMLAAIVDNATYPILAVNYLCQSGLVPDSIAHDHFATYSLTCGLVGLGCVLNVSGVEVVGRFATVLTVLILLPFGVRRPRDSVSGAPYIGKQAGATRSR